jgi:hypothetical protein
MPFKVVVTDAKGKTAVYTAAVGGASLDEDGVRQHYLDHNVFPGHRSLEVFPSGEKLPAKLEDVVAHAAKQAAKRKETKSTEETISQAEGIAVDDKITRSHLPDMSSMPGVKPVQAAAAPPAAHPDESKAAPGVAPAARPAGGPAKQ